VPVGVNCTRWKTRQGRGHAGWIGVEQVHAFDLHSAPAIPLDHLDDLHDQLDVFRICCR